ncbi:MAG: hypothetical protein GY838_09965 [bacterium]|nr:hypothetical protein [bacterium]
MIETMNWEWCQTHADEILAEGIHALRAHSTLKNGTTAPNNPGNYLISLNDDPLYIGESQHLAPRLKQQFAAGTSTFYKNYLRSRRPDPAPLDTFRVQYAPAHLGRKELEDFGIVNIPTRLNRFQLGKRDVVDPATGSDLWRSVQEQSARLLDQGETALWSQTRVPWFEAEVPKGAGLYVVWSPDHKAPIYIGESSQLANRYRAHGRDTYFSALRRHVGTGILGFELLEKDGKKRHFHPFDETEVTRYLASCDYMSMPVGIGRVELEELLIGRHRPVLNRKSRQTRPVQNPHCHSAGDL